MLRKSMQKRGEVSPRQRLGSGLLSCTENSSSAMNCPPFRPDTRRRQESSRISLRIGLCRRTISGSS
jgi:hypothetical protein